MLRSLESIFYLVGFVLDVSLTLPRPKRAASHSLKCSRSLDSPPTVNEVRASLTYPSSPGWLGAGFLPYPHLEYLRKYEGNFCMVDIYMAEGFAYRVLETLQLAVGCLNQSRFFVIQPLASALRKSFFFFSLSPSSPPLLFFSSTIPKHVFKNVFFSKVCSF